MWRLSRCVAIVSENELNSAMDLDVTILTCNTEHCPSLLPK